MTPLIEWDFGRQKINKAGNPWREHRCPLLRCMVSVNRRGKFQAVFCLSHQRFYAWDNDDFGVTDRYLRPGGRTEEFSSLDALIDWIVTNLKTVYDVYENSTRGEKNTDDGPVEWRRPKDEPLAQKPNQRRRVQIRDVESPHENEVVPVSHKNGKLSLLTKYRPETFEHVLGQEDVIAGLKSAIGKVNAFMLSGMSGVGKTTLARLAALYAGCHKDRIFEIDAARFNGVDAMTDIIEQVEHLPLVSTGPTAYIIDECQGITRAGWTLLLKTIEESPLDIFWLFCTTDLLKVPVNIKSQRCTVFHLQAVSQNDIFNYIGAISDLEELGTPDEVLGLCAQQALGSPRRALSFLSACSHCKTREEAARILNVAVVKGLVPDELGYRLAQALVTPKWRDIRKPLLRAIREAGEHPEGVRQVVRAYFSTVIDNEDDERAVCYALKVLDCFDQPLTDHSELQQAVGRVVFGVKDG